MPFDWREYYHLANSLSAVAGAGFSTEGTNRCAISRAYFSAFCWARDYAIAHMGFITTDDERDHGRLRSRFKEANNHALARKLDDLRGWRNDSDYKDPLNNLPSIRQQALQRAKEVINALTTDPAQKL